MLFISCMGHIWVPSLQWGEPLREPRHRCLLQPTWGAEPPARARLHSTQAPSPNTIPKLPRVRKYNGREPGKGKEMRGIAPHPEMESQCGTCIWAREAALIPPLWRSPQHNSSPPSTSPLDLLCSFEDCSTKTLSTENINLQVTSVLLTAFIQCSYFVVSRKALHLFSPFHARVTKGEQ